MRTIQDIVAGLLLAVGIFAFSPVSAATFVRPTSSTSRRTPS